MATFQGMSGNDRLWGETIGNDALFGGDGNDSLHGDVAMTFALLAIAIGLLVIALSVRRSGPRGTRRKGARHVAELRGGKHHGRGVLTLPGGARYEGEAHDGSLAHPTGARNEAEPREGKPHGRGIQTLTFPDGWRYEGETHEGKPHGRGAMVLPDGGHYEGEFLEGRRHGQSVLTFPGGARYEGETHDGKPHGQGAMTHPHGARYEGQWREGEPHGQGVEAVPDGQRYEGLWRDGKRHGQGVLTFQDGERYQGEYREGRRTGRGLLTWPDGRSYEGEFQDGERHGQGVMTWPDGERYEGEYREGKRRGRGVLTLPDGWRYEGEFLDGERHGQGTVMLPDGRRIEGGFRKGAFHGRVVVTLPDGARMEGECRDGEIVRKDTDMTQARVVPNGMFELLTTRPERFTKFDRLGLDPGVWNVCDSGTFWVYPSVKALKGASGAWLCAIVAPDGERGFTGSLWSPMYARGGASPTGLMVCADGQKARASAAEARDDALKGLASAEREFEKGKEKMRYFRRSHDMTLWKDVLEPQTSHPTPDSNSAAQRADRLWAEANRHHTVAVATSWIGFAVTAGGIVLAWGTFGAWSLLLLLTLKFWASVAGHQKHMIRATRMASLAVRQELPIAALPDGKLIAYMNKVSQDEEWKAIATAAANAHH